MIYLRDLTPDQINQAKAIGIEEGTLRARIEMYGWTVNKAITTPVQGSKNFLIERMQIRLSKKAKEMIEAESSRKDIHPAEIVRMIIDKHYQIKY